jgi:4-carboxymuconolactone decarboxylase
VSDYEKGMKVRREVLGDRHVDRAEARKGRFTTAFQEYITSCAWGRIWTRPGLGRRERSTATLAALVALRAEGEIEMHVKAALRNGLSADEIAEVIMHTGVYAGVPAANAAFAIAQATLEEHDAGDGRDTSL